MTDGFLVLAGPVEADTEVRRSRFHCRVERVPDEAAARAAVDRARTAHPDAGHHCSAYVLGPPGRAVERASDDGEPSGTAGAPMLEVLRGSGLGDVVAVVSRWFGGTLLGAGGLVRAYGDAVRAALEDAPLLRRGLLLEHVVEVEHADAGRVEGGLRARGVTVLTTTYADRVSVLVGVPPAEGDRLVGLVAELSAGAAACTPVGRRWVDLGPPV